MLTPFSVNYSTVALTATTTVFLLSKPIKIFAKVLNTINSYRSVGECWVPGLRRQEPFEGNRDLMLSINKPAPGLFSEDWPLPPPLYDAPRTPHAFPVMSGNKAGLAHLQNLVPFLKAFLLRWGTLLNASHKYPNVIAAGQPEAHAVSLRESHHFGIGAVIGLVSGKKMGAFSL